MFFEFKFEKIRFFLIFFGLKIVLYIFELLFLKINLRVWFLKDFKKKYDMDLIKMKLSDRVVILC